MATPIRTTVSALTTYLASNLPASVLLPGIQSGSSTSANNLATLSTALQSALDTYVALYGTSALPLTAIQPDYESNVAELQAILNASPDPAWNLTTPTSTGQTLLSMIATAQAFNQFSVERSLHESMLDFAQLPSSIYTISRMLGIRIARKQPANCSVTFTLPTSYTNSLTIPAYSSFGINGQNYFNRNQITFPANTTSQTIMLYQGSVSTLTFTSSGQPRQVFALGNSDFTISDADISCTVNNIAYTPTEFITFYAKGLWEYGPSDNVFYSTTDALGNAQIVFGDGNYGAIPAVNAPIVFTYAVTLGAAGNVDNTGQVFSYNLLYNNAYVQIGGVVQGPSQGGLDEREPSEYAIISPASYSAKLRPSTTSDYKVFALNYPNGGVIDAYVEGQQSYAPGNLNFMMTLRVTLLPVSGTTITFSDFVNWITPYSFANAQFISNAAAPVTLNISANVFCTDVIPLDTLENLITVNLNSYFTPRAGYLGYSVYMTDITSLMLNSDLNGNIQYVQLIAPTTDQILTNYQYLVLGTVSLNMQVSNRSVVSL